MAHQEEDVNIVDDVEEAQQESHVAANTILNKEDAETREENLASEKPSEVLLRVL